MTGLLVWLIIMTIILVWDSSHSDTKSKHEIDAFVAKSQSAYAYTTKDKK